MEANEDGIIEYRDANTEEEEQPQVRDSEESRPIVSASSSAINEANVSSSSRNVEIGQIMNADAETNPEQQFTIGSSSSSSVQNNFRQQQLSINESSETGEIQSVAEEDDYNDGDDEHETETEANTYGIRSLLPHLDPVFIGTPTSDQMMNPIGMQQQLNRNAAPSSPLNTSHQLPVDPFDQQRQLSPYAAPWRPQTTPQQLPVANQIPNLSPVPNQMIVPGPVFVDPNYAAWRLQNPYQHLPVANRIPYLAPVPNQMIVPGPAFLVPNYAPWSPENTYQQLPPYLMANQKNPYPPPMANMMMPRFRSDQMFRMIPPRGQPRPLAGVRNYFNPQQHFVLPEVNHQQLQQLQPQMQQPAQSQGFDVVGASSEQQPR